MCLAGHGIIERVLGEDASTPEPDRRPQRLAIGS
jgi:hypothetical protein